MANDVDVTDGKGSQPSGSRMEKEKYSLAALGHKRKRASLFTSPVTPDV
jgi:hypothetical protein